MGLLWFACILVFGWLVLASALISGASSIRHRKLAFYWRTSVGAVVLGTGIAWLLPYRVHDGTYGKLEDLISGTFSGFTLALLIGVVVAGVVTFAPKLQRVWALSGLSWGILAAVLVRAALLFELL